MFENLDTTTVEGRRNLGNKMVNIIRTMGIYGNVGVIIRDWHQTMCTISEIEYYMSNDAFGPLKLWDCLDRDLVTLAKEEDIHFPNEREYEYLRRSLETHLFDHECRKCIAATLADLQRCGFSLDIEIHITDTFPPQDTHIESTEPSDWHSRYEIY